MRKMVKAIIDVGSNSILLLIAEKRGRGWHILKDIAAVTALGENTKTSGLVQEPGFSNSLAKVKEFFSLAHDSGSNEVVAAATMALRLAKNRRGFLERAAAQGTPISILTGTAEANLGLLAVGEDPLFHKEPLFSIIDVGGHSTELVTAERTSEGLSVRFRKSYALGTLGLRETLLVNEKASPAELLKACEMIDETIALEYCPGTAGAVISLGATATNLASISDCRQSWDAFAVHGAKLTYEQVGKSVGMLFSLSDAERAEVVGIEPGRERTLHIGALILERFMHALHVDECRVSARGWRYALLNYDLKEGDLFRE